MDTLRVTRLEVVDSDGRVLNDWNAPKVTVYLQDDGKTMKLFFQSSEETMNTLKTTTKTGKTGETTDSRLSTFP